jgi:hypothetical protein
MTMEGLPLFSFIRPATMPMTPGCHPLPDSRVVMLRGQHRLCFFLHHRLDGAALFVELVKFGSDAARFFAVLGGQQAHAEVGLADAPACVDTGTERKTQVRANWRAGEAAGFDEGRHADIAPARHDLQSLRDKGTVQAA